MLRPFLAPRKRPPTSQTSLLRQIGFQSHFRHRAFLLFCLAGISRRAAYNSRSRVRFFNMKAAMRNTYILTAELDKDSFAWLNGLRQLHFAMKGTFCPRISRYSIVSLSSRLSDFSFCKFQMSLWIFVSTAYFFLVSESPLACNARNCIGFEAKSATRSVGSCLAKILQHGSRM